MHRAQVILFSEPGFVMPAIAESLFCPLPMVPIQGGHQNKVLQSNSTAQHSTAQHSTAQHSTAQHSTAQHSAAQRSIAVINVMCYLL